MTKADRRRLAAAVVQRRLQLGLAQGDLKGRGGPGVVTVGNVERCTGPVPIPSTLAALDRGLDWPSGTAANIARGGAAPVIAHAFAVAINADPHLTDDAKHHLLGLYHSLTRPATDPTPEQEQDEVDAGLLDELATEREADRNGPEGVRPTT